MLTKEQMDALPELLNDKWSMQVNDEYMEGNLWDGEGDLICTVYCRSDVEKVTKLIAIAPTLAATVIEQQAEIERLRGVIAIMDAVTPKADDTCDEPAIVLSVAVQRRYPHLSKGATQ